MHEAIEVAVMYFPILIHFALYFIQLSKFLLAMQDEGVVKINELSKGVESITEIDFKHPK